MSPFLSVKSNLLNIVKILTKFSSHIKKILIYFIYTYFFKLLFYGSFMRSRVMDVCVSSPL